MHRLDGVPRGPNCYAIDLLSVDYQGIALDLMLLQYSHCGHVAEGLYGINFCFDFRSSQMLSLQPSIRVGPIPFQLDVSMSGL